MIKNFFSIFEGVDNKFKIKFLLLNLLYILNSVVQSIYIISIAPIISYVISEDKNNVSKYTQKIIDFGSNFFNDVIVIFFVFFIISSLVANFFLIFLNFVNFTFNQNLLSNVRKKLFLIYANSNYLYISSNNISFYNTIIFQQVDRLVNNVFGSLILIIQNLFSILIILFSIVLIMKNDILNFFVITAFIFILAIFASKKYFSDKGENLSKILNSRLDILNKLILNFKEVQIFNLKRYLLDKYNFFENNYNSNIKYTSFFNHSTKPIFEILAVIFFTAIVYTNYSSILNANFLVQFSIIIFALYKILPSANVIYTSFNQINFDKSSVNKIYNQIYEKNSVDKNNDTIKKKNFHFLDEYLSTLRVKNLRFGYNNDDVIKSFNYNFEINKFYLIKGSSGKGKSTLMNLLIGLIPYDSGEILYNNQKFINFKNEDWYKKISYVPQRITLLNNTIRENITFSFENDIDEERYTNIMKKVNLYDEFINRENEIVSELSDNISGGQAQRIGLARALYRDSKIIFLDEPTSNLDEKNESDFLELVSNLRQNRMIIMISHKNHKNITFDDIIEL
jgi:ATP-binding cassette subfamily B protein